MKTSVGDAGRIKATMRVNPFVDVGGHMGIARRGVEACMAEQDLDHTDVDVLFE